MLPSEVKERQMPNSTTADGFDDLPVEEQLAHLEELWNRISATPGRVTTPDWHLEVVRERLAAHQAVPNDTVEWSVERRRIAEQLDKRRGG